MFKNSAAAFAFLLLFLLAPQKAHAVCSSPAGIAGTTLYNADHKEMQYCDNTSWISMGQGPETGPGCSSPAGTAGHTLYNKDYRVMQYCNGHEWVQMGIAGGDWKQVSSGYQHTCGIKTDDTLWCWGDNSSGRTGLNISSGETLVPTAINGGGTWKQVDAGYSHTCGIKADDTIWCWGNNSSGQVGDNTIVQKLIPTAINGGGTWKRVAASGGHSCGIKTDDTLWCWGANGNGQIGDSTSGTNRLIPTAVSGGGTWKQVGGGGTFGGSHSCGIKSDDTIWCWGYNWGGQIGDGTSGTDRLIPTAVSGGGTWKQVEGGTFHTCAIKLSDNTLWCWGYNTYGQVGDNTSGTNRLVPTAISGGGTWKQVTASGDHSCGIKTDDTSWCWGRNLNGELGDNTNGTDRLIPTAISGGGTWDMVSTGNVHTCGIKTDDHLWCWGSNTYGQLGDSSTIERLVPSSINGEGTWKQVTGGTLHHTCGIKTDDTLWCWGENASGQIGDNSTVARLVPTAINGGGTWKQVAGGTSHTCGIKLSDNTLWCWGSNASGQIGDNTSGTNRLVPTAISGGGTWKQVAAGSNHSCGIKMDDSLWCWGGNTNGQIGDNTSGTNRLIPTAINGGGTWKQVAAGSNHSCGIKMDDSLWCWGGNANGQLGDNTIVQKLVPTTINGGGTWKQVLGNSQNNHTCAIKSDDTVWCWGGNSFGQIGDSTSGTDRLIPTALSGGGTWKQLSAGGSHNCGIKTDDTMWCWGRNQSGAFGNNTTASSYSPTAVGGGGTWKQVGAGGNTTINDGHTCGIRPDDTMLCWGSNSDGQITATDLSAPFRLTGITPWCVSPSAKPGTVLYNSDFAVLQYCGGRWIGIGK